MMNVVNSIKKLAVALGYGTSVDDYVANTIVDVLKELAVKMEIASTTDSVRYNTTAEILNYIADNYGSEEKEPYDLVITDTDATVTVKRKGVEISEGTDILYDGDELTIEAEGEEGYEVTTLTVNGTAIESGDKITVSGKVTIVATGTIKKFDLARTATNCTIAVTKDGEAVTDGEDALEYGDEITITATTEEGYEMTSLTVNGEDFTSGETLTVTEDIEIEGTAEEAAE